MSDYALDVSKMNVNPVQKMVTSTEVWKGLLWCWRREISTVVA